MSEQCIVRTRRLRVEQLEERRVLAAFTVTNLLDGPVTAAGDLPGSLRQAVFDANATPGADEIAFPGLSGTITLTEGELLVTESVDFHGPGAELVTISGGGSSRVLNIDDGDTGVNQTVSVIGLTLTDGDTTGLGFDAQGGAVLSRESFVLAESVVRGNFAERDGGGLFVRPDAVGGSIVVRESILSGNRTDWGGGGAYFEVAPQGSLTIENSTFAYNEATLQVTVDGGGALIEASGDSTTLISSSSFLHNSAVNGGGGGLSIDQVANASVEVLQSTISGNSARTGAGIDVFGFQATEPIVVRHSTVSENSTVGTSGTVEGGGIRVFLVDLDLDHSIVAGNIDDKSNEPDISTAFAASSVTASFSLIGDNSGTNLSEAPLGLPDAAGNLIGDPSGSGVIDPLLGPLADFGGPGKVYLPQAGSPAVDAGDPAIATPPANDQRGAPFARVVDSDAVAGALIDIGATERQAFTASATLLVDSTEDRVDGDYSPGNLSLREAVGLANADANTLQIIEFSPALDGATLQQSLGTLVITDTVEVRGLGMDRLTVDGQGLAQVFRLDDGDDSVQLEITIEDLAVTGGRSTEEGVSVDDAAGIASFEQGRLRRLHVYGNHGVGAAGGIISNADGVATELVDSLIENNSSNNGAGGVALNAQNGGSLVLRGTTVHGNTAAASAGGAVVLAQSTGSALVEDSLFTGNTSANSLGGGLLGATVNDGSLTVRRSRISGNTAAAGGGAYLFANYGGSISASELEVSGNTTATPFPCFFRGGGGLQISSGMNATVIVENSTVSGNSSAGAGGGINVLAFEGAVISRQLTVSDNEAEGDGGGLHSVAIGAGLSAIQLSTITDNRANASGGGARGGGVFTLGGELSLDNTIVAGNSAQAVSDDAGADPAGFQGNVGVITAGDSLIGENAGSGLTESQTPDADGNLIGSAAGGGVIDARLGPLAANGGFAATHLPLAGSPAIDAGGSLGGSVPDFDQRGEPFARTVGAGRDIGAIEAQPNADFDGDGDVDLADLLAQQRGFGAAPAAIGDGDANGDEAVDAADLAIWDSLFGRGSAAGVLVGLENVLTYNAAEDDEEDDALDAALEELFAV
ncbi:MAG: choice-of-anchor Q domain-containing protein [Planctomycetota bacterium]